jgi:hypothetical protein
MGRRKKDPADKPLPSDAIVLEPRLDPDTNKMDVGGYTIPVTNTLTALLWGFANHAHPKAREYYFWRVADELWNHDDLPEKLFVKHPWAEQIIHECLNNKYLAVGGAASCVAGDTRMLNPLTGEAPTIQSLCESNTRPVVQTLNGPVLADVPYLKGTAELFEFKLSNGEAFRCTGDHRLLTVSGWQHASQTSVGARLVGYAACNTPNLSGVALQQAREAAKDTSPTREYGYRPRASLGLSVDFVEVLSIESVGVHDFYDLNVPVEHHYFAEGCVHHNSGKSHTLAGYGIICWLAQPRDTLVLMTSTTLREARKRIWGSVISLLSVIEGAPINIRDSIGSANYIDEKGQTFDRAGLSLIAAERSRTREAIGKFIGLKQKKVILIGDELGELSEAIMHAALSNLSKNPKFEFKGLSNPASRFDAFGVWSTPRGGWESVTPEVDDEWTTKWGGKYIRLDGERSPNVLAGREIYPFLPTTEKLEEDKALLGEKSRAYMRMVRAVFFDSDETEGIYSESEIINSGAVNKADFKGPTTLLAGVDPAFTNGGDRTVVYFARVGYDAGGQYTLQFEDCVYLNDDSTNKAVPRTYQIVRQIRDECIKRGVKPEDVAVDATGAGSPLCDLLAGEWSDEFLRVTFGGKASDRRVSTNSKLTGEELYVNRVSELWFVGKEFLRTRQIKGVTSDLAKEMTNRNYELIKSGTLRVKVEPKVDLRKRTGYSPDMADAAFIALEMARQRHGLVAVDPPKSSELGFFGQRMQRTIRDLDVVGRSSHSQMVYD